MNTNALPPHDLDDDFELPPLPRFVDYDEFVAQWEAEGRRYRRHLLKQSAKHTAKGLCAVLALEHWFVDNLQWAQTINWHHKHWQSLQVTSPLDSKVCLQTETAVRWVERDAYANNPHQWDSDGKGWLITTDAL